MANTTFQNLIEFVDVAEKNRKYGPNTALAFKAALRLFEKELNEQEKESVDVFRDRLEQISQVVHRVNSSKFTASTIETYKRRIKSLLKDYYLYAEDPSKMAAWNRPARVVRRKSKTASDQGEKVQTASEAIDLSTSASIPMTRFELPLRPSVKAIVLTPSDITNDETKKLKKYIEYLESLTELSENNSGS